MLHHLTVRPTNLTDAELKAYLDKQHQLQLVEYEKERDPDNDSQ